MSTTTHLLTAEEFAQLPNENGEVRELVRGEMITLNQPTLRHGQICARLARLLGNHADEHDLGHVISNDSGVITRRDPDTVRGGDVVFFSYARLPRGPLPTDYASVPPEIVIEVRSPSDRWRRVYTKVTEYLSIGVDVVCVIDPGEENVRLYFDEKVEQVLEGDDLLTFPQQLPGFQIPVKTLFK